MVRADDVRMPPSEEMPDLDRPATLRQLREELNNALQGYPTKEDAKAFLTKEDAKAFLTKEDAKAFLTKEDAKAFLTKEDAKAFLTKEDGKAFATKDDLNSLRDELRTHFDVVAEQFKSDFAN